MYGYVLSTGIKGNVNRENRNFDQQHELEINNIINNNRESFQPFPTVDLSRLDGSCPELEPTTIAEVKQIIRRFKNKAPGESGLTKLLLRQLPEDAFAYYVDTANESMSMGYFPTLFKKALLTFIEKPGKTPTDVNNYHPISLLEVAGKIYEKIILKRLNHFLEEKNLINENQYGFTKGRGTQVALAKLYETIAVAQSQGHGCNVVSRDISKAFDKVWHNGLKFKFWEQNPPEILLKTVCSFLDNRKASIRIGNIKGPEFTLKSGVPQGSVLSPTL